MAAAAALLAHLTTLAKETGAGTYTVLPETYSVQFFSADRSMIDVTHFTSPSYAREFMAGLTDWGECVAEIGYIWSNSVVAAIQAELSSIDFATLDTWQVKIGDTQEIFTFAGRVKSFSPKGELDGVCKATLTIKLTGLPTTLPA